MKFLRKSSEDEMIATFLKAELHSSRFSERLVTAIKKLKSSKSIIKNPNLSNPKQNTMRKKILSEFRDYEKNINIFENFPKNIRWSLVSLSPQDILKIKYLNYSYWVKITNGSRSPKDAAKTIRKGIEIFNESNERFFEAAESLSLGVIFPTIILVSAGEGKKLVVLEGHLRLTAYALRPKFIPNKVEAIIGYSSEFTKWDMY